MSILSILANIIVAAIVALLIWYAIQTIRKQKKEGGCGSCGKVDEDGKSTSACKGCAFSSSCHVVHEKQERK
ncbi:MAG: FeoB-associated Cys-rich membrane protein [Sphaerochaeta sp.]|nr:FeoB-associated Cys-rich membrane protein [Sphaerochaeta sp.]